MPFCDLRAWQYSTLAQAVTNALCEESEPDLRVSFAEVVETSVVRPCTVRGRVLLDCSLGP